MSNPIFQFVSPEILTKLASIKPYTVVVLSKGANYGLSDSPRIIQSEHLPYVFDQRDNNQMVLTMPLLDNDSSLAAITVYNSTDKEEVKQLMEKDPAVQAGVFNYEIITGMGLPGDKLP
jgi:uncharacterized protein YciI